MPERAEPDDLDSFIEEQKMDPEFAREYADAERRAENMTTGLSRVDGSARVLDVTNNTTPNTFTFAAAVGGGRWRGFTTREAAEAWASANSKGRFTQVVPACLADGVVAP